MRFLRHNSPYNDTKCACEHILTHQQDMPKIRVVCFPMLRHVPPPNGANPGLGM